MKKLFSLALAFIMTMSLAAPAAATSQESDQPKFTVTAPTFPDAYILTEYTPAFQYMDGTSGSLGSVSATVFVEESYNEVDGEIVVTDSRLLSESEVLAIGVENFSDLNTVATPKKAAVNSRGKLTITFSGLYNTRNGVSCDLTATADWDTSGFHAPGENFPDTGEDFIGVTWSGAFTSKSADISGTSNVGDTLKFYNSDSTPNGGRVWSFDDVLHHVKYDAYAKDIDLKLNISKNTLTGDGNTAEAVLKYIHTYSQVKGSISITPGSEKVAGSFSLSNTENQWPLVCTVTDIPF